jgi:ribosomal protein S18 acetylase RimI-like enzyme
MRSRRDRNDKVFSVLVIAVDPTIQHHGIGKMLMQRAEDTAIEHGYTLMHLSVDLENIQAIRFYEKLAWNKDREVNWRGSMLKPLPR